MRIADKMTHEKVNTNLLKNRTEMAELQHQAASQKRVNKPSDDPEAASRALSVRKEHSWAQQFLKNLNHSRSLLNFTDDSLGDLTELLIRAKELAVAQANDAAANSTTRQVVASEVAQLSREVVNIGNRKLGDRFLFGGFQTTRAPFASDGTYHGDGGQMSLQVGAQSQILMNIPGSQVFLGEGLGKDGFALRRADESPQTVEELRQLREQDLLNANPAEPTLPSAPLGPGPSLRGPASLSESPDSAPMPLLDETQSRQISYSWNTQGTNLFKVLGELEVGLRTDDKDLIRGSLDHLDEAIAQVIMARSQVGARVMALNSAAETLEKAKVDTLGSISQLEDADAFKVISDINKVENSLNATLASSGKMIQRSLLDFLK